MFKYPANLEELAQRSPFLYNKLCFWAFKRGVGNPQAHVQEYLTELIFEASNSCLHHDLLRKWTKILSPQERNALIKYSPIEFDEYPISGQWYNLGKGEYTVINEEVVEVIDYQKRKYAFITRNRYDCLVLNCPQVLIVDVDIRSGEDGRIQDCAPSCKVAICEKQAVIALAALIEQLPELNFRIYRTRNGLRHICVSNPFDPTHPWTQRIMQNLYVDPLYARLCYFQATFRARLSPKPWRLSPHFIKSFRSHYSAWPLLPGCGPYSVCHLVDVMGSNKCLPEIERIIEIHDKYCCVDNIASVLV